MLGRGSSAILAVFARDVTKPAITYEIDVLRFAECCQFRDCGWIEGFGLVAVDGVAVRVADHVCQCDEMFFAHCFLHAVDCRL